MQSGVHAHIPAVVTVTVTATDDSLTGQDKREKSTQNATVTTSAAYSSY
jgi:hypothetical protein